MVVTEVSGKLTFQNGKIKRRHLKQDVETRIDTAGVSTGSIDLDKFHPNLRAKVLAGGLRHFDSEAEMTANYGNIIDGGLVVLRNQAHANGQGNKKILIKQSGIFYGVSNVDETPVWTTEPQSSYTYAQNSGTHTIELEAEDPEGLPLTYTTVFQGTQNIASLSGSEISIDSSVSGSVQAVVSITDPGGNLLSKTITIQVN
jgi:hypothetical protein